MLTDAGVIHPNFTELRIYPSFSEIRQQYNAPQVSFILSMNSIITTFDAFVKRFKMYFSRDVFANISRGSLSIEGIPIQSKQVATKQNNLQNQTVFIRRYSHEEPRECRVIQADTLLLQDVKTNRYFQAQRHELEYSNIPEAEGTEVIYDLKHQGKATLGYQICGELNELGTTGSV